MKPGAAGGIRALKVHNRTRNRMLADKAAVAETRSERLRGLIGRTSLEEGEALIIRRCKQVHTFGMLFAIDVLFIDGSGVVVHALSGLKPRRVSRIVRGAHAVIELPRGVLDRTGTLPGDFIELLG